jgi:hypothetical protein
MSTGVLHSFYCSKEWLQFRIMIIQERSKNGCFCEECGGLILSADDIHIHHTPVELTEQNYKNKLISLNPDNVKMIHKECHDKIHGRFCKGAKKKERGIYIVCGPPMAGKSTYVNHYMTTGDLMVDMDRIYQAISYKEEFDKPENLKYNAFAIRNLLIDNIKTRYGDYKSAWIIGGYPNKVEREQLAYRLGAEIVLIEVPQEECIKRLDNCMDFRRSHKHEWKNYIEDWFFRFSK